MNHTKKLETKRLIIKPLSAQEMKMYLLNDYSLESFLNVEHEPRIVNKRIRFVIENKIIPNLIDETKDHLYYTLWSIISKEKNVLVADLCFKGEPNENGEVEIGYGTFPTFQGNGYMTEAIGGIVKWAFDQDIVNAILAETDPNNIASITVLKKNGFIIEKEAEDNLYWRLNKK